jgi:hypothetical protein
VIAGQVIDYRTRTGPDLFTRRLQLNKTALTIIADPTLTSADRAARYRGEILIPRREIILDAESYVPPNDRGATVHRRCVAALRLAVAANENIARTFELNNQILLTQGQRTLRSESVEWRTWMNEVSQL